MNPADPLTVSSDSDVAALSDLEQDDGDEEGEEEEDEDESGLPYPGFIFLSMKYLDQNTRPRNWCLKMITNPWFERVSMLVILLNCVTLGMYQPCEEGNCESSRCQILQVFDDFIFGFFTLEMTVKMIAMGCYGKGTYLADHWNKLDFVIVLAGALEYCLNVENKNFAAIRTIRVLRPLRAINRIPSMRILVMLLLDTLPMLGNVLLLCFFVFFIFGIVGVQLWEGILRQRCYLKSPPNISFPQPLSLYYQYMEQDRDYICSKPEENGMHSCYDLPPYKEGDMVCNGTALPHSLNLPTNASCVNWNQYYTNCTRMGDNPFQGTISFDNIGLAWVAIFLVISLEGWTDIMYYVQDAHSFWDWIYFVLLIVIGSFFMINLCLVVIATQFSETKKREMERMRLERARFHSTSTLASSTNNSEPATCYAEIVKYVAHLWRRSKRRLLKKYRLFRYKRQREMENKLISNQSVNPNTSVPPVFSMQHCGGAHEGPGPPNYHHFHHHHHYHHHQHYHHHHQHIYRGACPHSHHSCKHHHCSRHHVPPARPPEGPPSPPRASPEVSDLDLQCSPRSRRVSGSTATTPTGGLLRVNPPVGTNWGESPIEESQSAPMLLSPPTSNGHRRRSSVMFSDEVTMVTLGSEQRNVCSSEKMTQTGEGDVWISPREDIQAGLDTVVPEVSAAAMTCQELLAFSGALSAALPTGQTALESLFSSLSKGVIERGDRWDIDSCSCCGEIPPPCPGCAASAPVSKDGLMEKPERGLLKRVLNAIGGSVMWLCRGLRLFIKALVEHKYFQQGILLAILFNTLSMGIEYHNQPPTLTTIVEISNIVFSAIFAVEMILKIVAEGPFGYISNGFNVFDGVIVILSVVELCQTFLSPEGTDRTGGSGLSVLRTFRLLRILKLVRFMPNLRRQLFVMLRTMDNVAVFFSLLILFIFIFSILGMNIFGCKFYYETPDGKKEFDRKNFDSLLWALVTVFQILTQEDWNVVLFNGMEKTSHWAALYFVALMTFGNYVLFNLLVAILVEGFSSERNERREREARELEKQREKAAEIAAALFEEATKGSSCSEGSEMSLQRDGAGKWRSAEDIHSARYRKAKMNDVASKDAVWNVKQNLNKPELKCNNVQKESQMLLGPQSPPMITHTAATPQDSPNTTVDPSFREFNSKLTPSVAFYSSSLSIDSIDRSTSSQCSIPGLLKPPGNQKMTINNLSGSTPSSLGRRVSLAPTATKDSSSPCGTPRRVGSWRISRSSLRRKSRHGSEAEDGDQQVVLNNNNHTLSELGHCNGKLHPSSTIRNDTQSVSKNDAHNGSGIINKNESQNGSSVVKKDPSKLNGLSPQNSIRSQRRSSTTPLTQVGRIEGSNASNLSCSKKDNTETSPKPNGKQKTSGISSVQVDDQPVKTVNVPPTEPAGQACQQETEESQENLAPLPVTPRDSVQKIFIFFRPPKALLDRDHCSLYLFAPNNKFRQSCVWVVERKWFDNAVLLFIGLNCITLAMERPNIPPDSTERLFLLCANYVFTVVFALEMFVKVIASGMLYGEEAYFTSGWNIMDGSLVIISIIDLLMSLLSESSPRIFGILRVFRLLRSLRPLRVINRAPGLKLVVQTLLSSLRPIGNIVLICCTFFIIFGILGVQLFKGSFFFCDGPHIEHVKTRSDCEADRRNKWLNRKYNFDDLGQALMSLFVLSSRDGWVNIMYTGLDAVGLDMQPIKNYSEWRLLYFISFILLVGFFVLNMFVGVVVENFHRCREEQEKEERMLRLAKRAKQMEKKRRKMHQPPYYTNYSKLRLVIHNVVTSKYFDLAIAGVIGLNVVTMAMEFYLMPRALEYALKIFNYFFTAVFILELFMKLLALGFKMYLKDRWNQLDVGIVFLSIVGIVLEELQTKIIPINPTIIRVMRVLRIARVLKLLKMAKGIRALLDTVMQALPQVGNLGLLFFLLFFIFAALGVELFGRLECSDELPCQGLGEHAHFSNFGMAFLTLFRVATGDNWNGIMKDTLREDCDKNPDCVRNCCVSTIIAPIFFVIFVLMAQFVLVNVVVAVLMKHLEESHKQSVLKRLNLKNATRGQPPDTKVPTNRKRKKPAKQQVVVSVDRGQQMEDELDMEVELERELQQEQDDLEDELCLQQALDEEEQMERPIKRPLGKVLSLPANFTYSGGSAGRDTFLQFTEDPTRRGSSISYQSHNKILRRQTFHSQWKPTTASTGGGYTSVYTTDQDRTVASKPIEETKKKIENLLERRKSLRRMSSVDGRRRASLSAGNSRRGSLLKPRGDFLEMSKSTGVVPTPKQLLSLTELVIDEKEREKRILRKALSMETRTTSDDISPECLAPSMMLIPPPYPGDKQRIRSPDPDKLQKMLAERRPSFRQQKSTETMEKIEEDVLVQSVVSKKPPIDRKKSMFRQMSLDSTSRPSQPLEDKFLRPERAAIKRQMTCPAPERCLQVRKPGLMRQDRQEIISTESLIESDVHIAMMERPFLKKSSTEDTETAETSLMTPEKIRNETGPWERKPNIKDSKLLGASMETTSTSSNSTNMTNLRSDSVVSEEGTKEEGQFSNPTDCIVIVEEIVDVESEPIKQSGSKEKLIGTSSEECYDTSEDDH